MGKGKRWEVGEIRRVGEEVQWKEDEKNEKKKKSGEEEIEL